MNDTKNPNVNNEALEHVTDSDRGSIGSNFTEEENKELKKRAKKLAITITTIISKQHRSKKWI